MKMVTQSGRLVDPWNVKPGDLDLHDIATALSRIIRYTGHSRISVAAHSLTVLRVLQHEGASLWTQRLGLLHDASEAYLGDIAAPVKRKLGRVSHDSKYHDAEGRAMDSIIDRFGVRRSLANPTSVHSVDTRVAATEMWHQWAEHRDVLASETPELPSLVIPWLAGYELWDEDAGLSRHKFLDACERLDIR